MMKTILKIMLLALLGLGFWNSTGQAQTPADSIQIPKSLYRNVQRYLAEWDSLSRIPAKFVRPDTVRLKLSKKRFQAIYPDIISNLWRYQSFRLRGVHQMTETIRALIKIQKPDTLLTECALYRFPDDSCLIISRKFWQKSLKQLEILNQIYNASTKDSTLIFKNTALPVVSETFWGRSNVTLSGKIIFRSQRGDTLYTLAIKRLKVPVQYQPDFWRAHLTMSLQLGLLPGPKNTPRNWTVGLAAMNYRRFFLHVFLGLKGFGGGLGYRLFEHAGPTLGIENTYWGVTVPAAGFAFLLN
ncbi:hypothetical protein BMS3Abin05_01176 [bacterium BMS3Abin05]|nr:hypothetical protein BMS3Abin05_01176 [bacterium BMS3Abin05]